MLVCSIPKAASMQVCPLLHVMSAHKQSPSYRMSNSKIRSFMQTISYNTMLFQASLVYLFIFTKLRHPLAQFFVHFKIFTFFSLHQMYQQVLRYVDSAKFNRKNLCCSGSVRIYVGNLKFLQPGRRFIIGVSC